MAMSVDTFFELAERRHLYHINFETSTRAPKKSLFVVVDPDDVADYSPSPYLTKNQVAQLKEAGVEFKKKTKKSLWERDK